MSFVLQLGTVEMPEESENNNPSLLAQELPTPLTIGTSLPKSVIPSNNNKMQSLPNSKTMNTTSGSTCSATSSSVKPVTVTYPANKASRDAQKMTGSQTSTTQVLTTRVISQKLSSSNYQVHPNSQPGPTQNINQQVKIQSTSESVQSKTQTTTIANLQSNIHQKFQQVSAQQMLNTTGVKTISPSGSMTNIQRIHLKAQNVGGQSQTVNLQKVKTITNVNSQATVQRNPVSMMQTAPKSQVLTSSTQGTQITMNQVMSNANMQRVQQTNSSNLEKAQATNVTSSQKSQQQLLNNQKIMSQPITNVTVHSNHKVQQQQQSGNQQSQQALHKVQGLPQKTLAVQRQQQTVTVNNIQKSVNSVAGMQKSQMSGQQQNQQSSQQTQKHSQPLQSTQQPRPQSIAGLQKSQTLAAVNSNKTQRATSVSKSSSVPNITKLQQNSNLLTVSKQQVVSQPQQIHVHQSSQLQQQLLHQPVQQQQQNTQKQQQSTHKQQQGNASQIQRSQSVSNIQKKITTGSSISNNQRAQTTMNSKMQQQQQHMVLRVGAAKNQSQNLQPGNVKPASQKITNSVKPLNPQNTMQQPIHRNANMQPVKIIQQQQNVIGPQNAQKQPGCIKTIPAQKPTQRNHAQKMAGIKTSLNTNMNALKAQGSATTITQKTSIKTLLPQQTSGPSMLVHKNQPIKIQQQTIQQKQLIMAPQYTQQVRPQSGQIKTLLPVTSGESRRDMENKSETEFHSPKEEESQHTLQSPVRRMPLPYEFVLQDHNYGAPPPRTPPPASPPPHVKQQPINGAGSATVTAQHPYIYSQAVTSNNVEDDAASAISSEAGREAEPEGEETETAAEGEEDDENSVTRCICDFEHDDGYMICCDRCLVWQHVDCMGIDRSNIPDEYLCEICRPRRVDRQRARALQLRKREELLNSDTSSDTSSTSSADTDVGVNVNQKKRTPQQQVPRRKSDPPPQVRRLSNNNNNNNVAKRQRRESHPRQSSAVRKKETVKRGPGKRKTKRRMSLEDREEDTQDAWGTNMAPLRQWIERYEEAVTNHYSPELRARISSIKVNGAHGDLRQSNMNAVAAGKCRLNVHSNNLRFLVATMYLPPNTPVVELRGKYMLSTQHRPSHPQGRQHAQRPGPFVFFYRLPRDGTEVCVDTRTYGNDARFVRRSCKPNAEVKHCIEKGTLHLYIVTTTAIEKNAEITIRHEQHDLMLSPNPNSPLLPVVCACNNPRDCQIASMGQLNRRGSNGALAENADGRERRRRGRRNTICEDSDSLSAISSTSITQPTPAPTPTPAAVPPKKTIPNASGSATVTRQATKEEPPTVQRPQTSPVLTQPPPQETKKDKKKMTREERKMEAIMKAFERLEKAEQRKQEVQARNAQRKESGGTHSDNEDSHGAIPQSKTKQQNSERTVRRKRRKGRARTTSSSQSQSNRRTRLNSADSDISSGEESNSMQSPPLPNQNCPPNRGIPYASHLHTPTKDGNESINPGPAGHQGIPTAAGLLLALANSNVPGPSSPPLQQPTPVKSPTCDSGASSSSQSSTPSTPLSSACLLVAAAVGPLAPGFKFPKTKKVLMNEWLKESPDPPQTHMPQVSPLPALPPAPLTTPISQLTRPTDFLSPTDPSPEFLTQNYAAKSLATLVQAANSVSGICDSPPQRRQTVSGNSLSSGSTGSAKKRWLRQAISEECDSPNSRPESPPSEMVAPPKKRRIARESLSSDNYTPPTTPTMLLPDPTSISKPLCSNEDEFIEQQSPNMEQHSGQQDYECEPTKEEVHSESEPMDLDDTDETDKVTLDIPQSTLCVKNEKADVLVKQEIKPVKVEAGAINEELSLKDLRDQIKVEALNIKRETDVSLFVNDTKNSVKSESQSIKKEIQETDIEMTKQVKREIYSKKKSVPMEEEKGTVEIVDQNEADTEMEDLSSPIAAMESDAVLKERVAELRLEFGGNLNKIVNITNENDKSDDEKKSDIIKSCELLKSDDTISIDEFDVEAQMKKITGDDGNDYKEKVDTSSEKDKSMDGIEGLMESSKEDSESEDRDIDDLKEYEESFKDFDMRHEERAFKEFETKPEQRGFMKIDLKETIVCNKEPEPPKSDPTCTSLTLSEESMFESTSSNIDIESSEPEAPKLLQSIPPLSERIRKKPEQVQPSKTLDFEASIIESTIELESGELSKNGEEKSILSTALRELLEAKIDVDPPEPVKPELITEVNISSHIEQVIEISSGHGTKLEEVVLKNNNLIGQNEKPPVKEEDPMSKEVKRLKDPRTIIPTDMPAPPPLRPEVPTPVKRKVRTLSISEYRKRKQQSSGGTPPEPEPSNDASSSSDKGTARGRSDSASSGTSSLSSDEEGVKASVDIPSLTALPLFINPDGEEKKGAEEGVIGWSAAPTLVERQRENLTERLKREFGLFLSDDEEERARKQGLSAEAILKARKTSPPAHPSITTVPPIYPLPQLPPQPYIPPPGSAPIHYPQFQSKSVPVQYPTFPLTQAIPQPIYPSAVTPQPSTTSQSQQFLVPQAPPGSNPYPPQFVPSTSAGVPAPRFPPVTPPTGPPFFPPPLPQPQKPFFNHTTPRS
ncbi:uncharacterized protein LOC107270539 isoform X2 [Cephus cinctus]|uniref:Uncharacterized protein LOC107270539 isoform X2 n=1 Tax=Cephus cinctus TaxID=211228 RepID=A0AAJ7RND9_CEPCN|nr:uncharacterized protein LOC107270539 isoform X2 [Cephus cinctus]